MFLRTPLLPSSLLAVACLVALAGCGPRAATRVAAPSSGPVTHAEAEAYFARLDAAVQGDPGAGADVFDVDALADLALSGLDVTGKDLADFKRGLQASSGQDGFLPELRRQVAEGATFKFLRTKSKNGRLFVVCRILGASGTNFFEFRLRKDPAGRVRADDVYLYASGEMFSETLRRMLTQFVAESNRSVLARLAGRERELVDNFPKLTQMLAAIREKRGADALATYRTLPVSLQGEKFMLLLRVRAASGESDQTEYRAALEDFRRLHPTDPAVDLLSIDHFFLQGDFAATAEATRRIDEAVGGDSHLKTLRAICLSRTGKFDEARREAEAAVALDPTNADAQVARVQAEVGAGRFDAALALLKSLEGEFPFLDWETTLSDSHYAPFLASPAGQAWQQHRREKR